MISLRDLNNFGEVCSQFYFLKPTQDEQTEKIVFVSQEKIFTLNFKTLEIETIHEWSQ